MYLADSLSSDIPPLLEYVYFYLSRFLPDGAVFDASNAPGRKPIAFQLGKRQVIKGWEEVLRLMNVRPKRRDNSLSPLPLRSRGGVV